MTSVEILLTLAGGVAIGAVARYAMPGEHMMGWDATSLLGAAGAYVGAVAGEKFGPGLVGEPIGWIGAVFGAVILLAIYRASTRSAPEMHTRATMPVRGRAKRESAAGE
ncbi:MAG: GlsB/YeaQ/YmgE family stress response membrane protein [Burkholderiales bacterium]